MRPLSVLGLLAVLHSSPALAASGPDLDLSVIEVEHDGNAQIVHLRASNLGTQTAKGFYVDAMESSEFTETYSWKRYWIESLKPGEKADLTHHTESSTFKSAFFADLEEWNTEVVLYNNFLLIDRCALARYWTVRRVLEVEPGGLQCKTSYAPLDPSVVETFHRLGQTPPAVAETFACGVDLDKNGAFDACPAKVTGMDHLDLVVDVAKMNASARLDLAPSFVDVVKLEVRDAQLDVDFVKDLAGVPLRWEQREDTLYVERDGRQSLYVTYGLEQGQDAGVRPSGETILWPDNCGALFPCVSEPRDGLTFALDVIGEPPGTEAVFASSIPTPGPSYMVAWAMGPWADGANRLDLGVSDGGVQLYAWHLPGNGEASARAGTADLTAAFSFFEDLLGPYPYGEEAGSVAAGTFSGMEHHPFWHVRSNSMSSYRTHMHEAAHRWYGTGVRTECWEDLAWSEGTVTSLTARAIEHTMGAAAANAEWNRIRARLARASASSAECGQEDVVLELFGNGQPYYKGALFYKAVEAEVGRAALDDALAMFFQGKRGTSASMADMLDIIHATTGFDPEALAQAWLLDDEVPAQIP